MNGIITVDHTLNDQVNVKYTAGFTKQSNQEKKNEEELSTGRLCIINAFERGIFLMRHLGIAKDDDEDDHYIYDDEQ